MDDDGVLTELGGMQNYKFGILSTDIATGETKWKKSAYFYRDFIKAAKERER